jgi:hypothetical protein
VSVVDRKKRRGLVRLELPPYPGVAAKHALDLALVDEGHREKGDVVAALIFVHPEPACQEPIDEFLSKPSEKNSDTKEIDSHGPFRSKEPDKITSDLPHVVDKSRSPLNFFFLFFLFFIVDVFYDGPSFGRA